MTAQVSAIRGATTGNKGLPQLLLMKRDLNHYMRTVFLQKNSFSTTAKVELARVFLDCGSYRASLKPYPDDPQPDLCWTSSFSKADKMLLEFWEDRCSLADEWTTRDRLAVGVPRMSSHSPNDNKQFTQSLNNSHVVA